MSTWDLKSLETLWIAEGGNPAIAPTMAAIAMAESGGNPNEASHNTNGTTDRGLWQINDVNNHIIPGGVGKAFDPAANAKAAIAIEKGSGLGAWTTYTSGAFAKFLVPARAALAGAKSDAARLGAVGAAQAGGISGAVNSAANAVSGAVNSATSVADLVTSVQFWVRLGEGIAGIVLIAIGLRSLTGQEGVPGAKTAATVAKVVR